MSTPAGPLTITIQTGSTVSIHRQIVEQVCAAVFAGRIGDDEPLPSVRALAEQLVVNPNTVARAYGELTREGVLESRAGKGMFVSQRRQIYSARERARRMEQAVSSLVSEGFMLGFTPAEIVELVAAKTRHGASSKNTKQSLKSGAR
ncbi:MAG TPA: GntR family transcriptional regulator [Gemmatimonadaceae bacterium]|jgi:GntR family transcriptional regulator